MLQYYGRFRQNLQNLRVYIVAKCNGCKGFTASPLSSAGTLQVYLIGLGYPKAHLSLVDGLYREGSASSRCPHGHVFAKLVTIIEPGAVLLDGDADIEFP